MRAGSMLCSMVAGLAMVAVTDAAAKPQAIEAAASEKVQAAAERTEKPDKQAELKPQTHCPIMTAMQINKHQYVDHEGQRIYTCCGGCRRAVARDFDVAAAKLAEMGQRPHIVKEKTEGGGKAGR